MFHKNIIRLLPDSVCSQISAGEVVQRPASVVKELLENALDADAKEIKIILEEGGKTLIQVIDDGIGMSAVDARMSLEKHATSKIHTAEDLYAIKTMGFRGEAIASIVAVAQCVITTRPKNIKIGTKIIVEGSNVITQEPINTHVGTNFIVRNLFYNIPARRVFLKSAEIEMRHVVEEFRQIALARHDIHLTLISNKQEIYDLQPTTLINRIIDIFGSFYRKKLLHCHDKSSFVAIDGFISDPSCNKKQHFLFANNRFIKSSSLQKVIYDAYDSYLTKDKKISYVLFLNVAPDKIDVNLHPAKTEVRFHDEELIAATMKRIIRKTLTFTSNQEIDFNPEHNIGLNLESFSHVQQQEEFIPNDNNTRYDNSTKHESLQLYFQTSIEELHNQQQCELLAESSSTMLFVRPNFIISTVRSGVLIIDYKRASERITFEEEMQNIEKTPIVRQKLLFPLRLNTDIKTYNLLRDNKIILKRFGFEIELLKTGQVLILASPSEIDEKNIKTIIDNIPDQETEHYLSRQIALQHTHNRHLDSSKTLNAKEMKDVIDQLFSCNEQKYSPTGEVIWTILNQEEIKKTLE